MASTHEAARRYQAWLGARTEMPAEVISGLSEAKHLPLDKAGLAARGWHDLPIDWLPEPGAIYAGGYGEDRAIYDTPVFAPDGEEPRSVHIGLDVFAPAGTRVLAPLEARVHSLQRNDNPKDYGPTLILEHEACPGLVFHTLYGHLALDVLTRWRPGDTLGRGAEIAQLGGEDINGGWAPHLHFQVILDMAGGRGDFPGVAKRSEKDKWLACCPDPRVFLGLSGV